MATDVQDRVALPSRGASRSKLFFPHLITLLVLTSESAAIAYPRRLHMPDINRQLIFVLGIYGSATSKELMIQSGREKAQISRGLKALSEAGLLDRPTTRGAIRLSPSGERMFAEVIGIAQERNAALCAPFGDDEVQRFLIMTAAMIDKASSIFLADEAHAPLNLTARTVRHHPPELSAGVLPSGEDQPSFRDLLLPWIKSLATYLRRSGENLFLREVGMSAFEWRVLAQVEDHHPINLSQLNTLLSRDKGQVARMIKKLTLAGLIRRIDERRTNVALELTAAGRVNYDRICAISAQRDAVMFADFTPDDRVFYMDMMARLIDSARAMLASEVAARDRGNCDA